MPGQLDRPVLPRYLYRYRKINDSVINQEVRTIRETYLWCSTYKAMNDPMEGFFEPTRQFLKDNNYNRASRDILNQKIQIGICCFSDTCDNELMWRITPKTTQASASVMLRKSCCPAYRTTLILHGSRMAISPRTSLAKTQSLPTRQLLRCFLIRRPVGFTSVSGGS